MAVKSPEKIEKNGKPVLFFVISILFLTLDT